ncbi:hypothetical protein Tco_0761564 [Tanacetum coccineum]
MSITKPSSLVTPPPINTEATTIITPLPEITPFISLQLRVARLEQEMSEVKKTGTPLTMVSVERKPESPGKGCALHHWVHDVVFNVSNQLVILTAYVLTRFLP